MLDRARALLRSANPGLLILVTALMSTGIVIAVVAMRMSLIHEQVYHDYARSKANAEAQERFEVECREITIPERAVECFQKAIDSARESQRAEEDLYAQKQMALWAEWMVYVTLFVGVMTIFVAFASVGLLIQANTLNRETLIADQRAWVRIDEPEVITEFRWESETRASFGIRYRIENIGKSPAYNISVHELLAVNGRKSDAVLELISALEAGGGKRRGNLFLFPNDVHDMLVKVRVKLPECTVTWPKIVNRSVVGRETFCSFYVIGIIRYDVAFVDQYRYTAFTYHLTEPDWAGPINIDIGCDPIPAVKMRFRRAGRNGMIAT